MLSKETILKYPYACIATESLSNDKFNYTYVVLFSNLAKAIDYCKPEAFTNYYYTFDPKTKQSVKTDGKMLETVNRHLVRTAAITWKGFYIDDIQYDPVRKGR